MTAEQINTIYQKWKANPRQDNLDDILRACLTITKQYMSLHPRLEADHEDICQEVVVTAANQLEHLSEKDGSFSAWLWRVTANRCVDYERAHTRKKEDEFAEECFAAIEPKPTFLHSRLKHITGDNFRLYQDLLRGYSLDEVAARHNISKNALQMRMKRIKSKVAKNV